SPAAAKPATTKPAPARISGASTGAPDRLATPLITAALLSIATRTSAPMRASSFTYEKRALKIDSSTTLVPGQVAKNPTTCGCRSVGNPGNGAVSTLVPPVIPSACTRIQSVPVVVTTPHSANLSSALRKWSGRQAVTVTSPRVTAPANSSVPVTIRSGMISYSVPCSDSTPSIATVSVP